MGKLNLHGYAGTDQRQWVAVNCLRLKKHQKEPLILYRTFVADSLDAEIIKTRMVRSCNGIGKSSDF